VSEQQDPTTDVVAPMGRASRIAAGVALACAVAAFALFRLRPEAPALSGLVLGFGLAAALAVFVFKRHNAIVRTRDEEIALLRRQSADNIAEARERERAAGEKAARLALALDELPVGVFATDGEGNLTYANRTLGRWVDRPAAGLIGSGAAFASLFEAETPPPSDGVGSVRLRRVEGGGLPAYVMRNRAADGKGSRGVILRDPEGDRPDETADEAEQGVGETAAPGIPPWLFDDVPVGMAILSGNGTITDCNAALCRFLGEPRDALIG